MFRKTFRRNLSEKYTLRGTDFLHLVLYNYWILCGYILLLAAFLSRKQLWKTPVFFAVTGWVILFLHIVIVK